MRVNFVAKENGPERLVCEAEIVFDDDGPLAGMKLVGFSLWRSAEGEVYVTFPSRAFGSSNDRRYLYLWPAEGVAFNGEERPVKEWILDAYKGWARAAHDLAGVEV